MAADWLRLAVASRHRPEALLLSPRAAAFYVVLAQSFRSLPIVTAVTGSPQVADCLASSAQHGPRVIADSSALVAKARATMPVMPNDVSRAACFWR